jgi:hypothetical protein
MNRTARSCLEWVACHALAFALFAPWARMEGDAGKYGFTALPLLFAGAQLYPLRRHVRWWAWLPASYLLGYVGSFTFLMLYFVAMGFTLAFAQALCLAPRRPLAALLWFFLGAGGWVLGIFLSPSLILREDGIVYWIIPFACYALAVLPAVLLLTKDAPAET